MIFSNIPSRASANGSANNGANDEETWANLVNNLVSRNQGRYTNAATPGFNAWMQTALAGEDGLPRESYLRALAQGQNTINAQTAQSRANLQQSLGSRGLSHSGMMARGLQGVEDARISSLGALEGGLAQQSLAAARQSQLAAASMMPSLINSESSSMNDLIRSYLALRSTDLERQRIGIERERADNESDNGLLGIIGGLFG